MGWLHSLPDQNTRDAHLLRYLLGQIRPRGRRIRHDAFRQRVTNFDPSVTFSHCLASWCCFSEIKRPNFPCSLGNNLLAAVLPRDEIVRTTAGPGGWPMMDTGVLPFEWGVLSSCLGVRLAPPLNSGEKQRTGDWVSRLSEARCAMFKRHVICAYLYS